MRPEVLARIAASSGHMIASGTYHLDRAAPDRCAARQANPQNTARLGPGPQLATVPGVRRCRADQPDRLADRARRDRGAVRAAPDPVGRRLRAAGDRPDALVAVGVSPTRARLAAALVGGALAGAGGAQLSLAVGGFVADMSSGRGYIALAMVILSGWRRRGP
jgi:Branched-chain amino acid transport system / permease component